VIRVYDAAGNVIETHIAFLRTGAHRTPLRIALPVVLLVACPWRPRRHCTITSAAAELGTHCMERQPSNQPMKPTAALRGEFSVLATTPCRGLSLSR
jgi:hypothetical protein